MIISIVLFIAGFVVGCILMDLVFRFRRKSDAIGRLVIIEDPEDGPYMFIEFESAQDISNIRKVDKVSLNVDDRGMLSQK